MAQEAVTSGGTETPSRDVAAAEHPFQPAAFPVNSVRFQTGHTNAVSCVAFSPVSPNMLASGSADNTVRLWNVRSMEQMVILQGHTAAVTSIAFNRQGP